MTLGRNYKKTGLTSMSPAYIPFYKYVWNRSDTILPNPAILPILHHR